MSIFGSPDVALPITFQKDQLPSGTESAMDETSVSGFPVLVGDMRMWEWRWMGMMFFFLKAKSEILEDVVRC